MVLIIGTPKVGTPNFGKLSFEPRDHPPGSDFRRTRSNWPVLKGGSWSAGGQQSSGHNDINNGLGFRV